MVEKGEKKKTAETKGGATEVNVRWNDANLVSSYANVCNVSSTREEMTLLFGTNQTWNTGQTELTVDLTNRIVMNPFAAKRLSLLLDNVVKQYEANFGELSLEQIKK
jgi:hypothetical protein